MPATALLEAQESRRLPGGSSSLETWLALTRVAGLGPVRTAALLEAFDSPEGIFAASPQELLEAVPSMPESVRNGIVVGPDLAWSQTQQEHALREGVQIVAFDSAAYPPRLRAISSPPPVLFCKGPLACDHFRPVGVVGTRRPTELGRKACRDLVQEWAGQGIRIVSGLAMGIDETAHRATLEVGGETIAVLGSGIDCFGASPRRELFERIAAQGLLISEFPMGLPPSPQTFPRRNRIISGLSRAVVVAEAGIQSGALITARECLDQDRELLAMPGPAGWPSFSGCHRLLRQGAALCAEASDLHEACGWRTALSLSSSATAEVHPIVALLRCEPLGIEELSLRSGRPIPWLLSEASKLEIQGLIRRLPGGVFAPC